MLADIAALVFPIACVGCGVRARSEPLCDSCASSLPRAPRRPPPPGIDAVFVPFAHEGVARELVARAKYRNLHAVIPWLAARIADELRTAPVGVEVVTWAPTTPRRRRARGFDHARLLAEAVGRELAVPVRDLLRRAPGPPQTGLDRTARACGPRFEARRRPPRSVLLVDDVVTTGATLRAGASVLRRAGAERLVAGVVTRRP